MHAGIPSGPKPSLAPRGDADLGCGHGAKLADANQPAIVHRGGVLAARQKKVFPLALPVTNDAVRPGGIFPLRAAAAGERAGSPFAAGPGSGVVGDVVQYQADAPSAASEFFCAAAEYFFAIVTIILIYTFTIYSLVSLISPTS